MLSVHDAPALEQFFRRRRVDPYLLKRLRYLLYAENRSDAQLVDLLPVPLRHEFVSQFSFAANELVERHDSQCDASSKLIFRTRAGLRFESVIMRSAGGRTSLCISSQVGCAAKCAFCATGQMNLLGNLSEAEIIDQVVHVNRLLECEQRRVRNVVFMGMGEPFHNEAAVYGAIEKLQSPAYFGLSPKRILVSTVGIPAAMERFAERFPQTGLALSLHSARQSLRESLIPLAHKYDLAQLRASLRSIHEAARRPLMIEYLMLHNVNDADEDADLLVEYLCGLRVNINLIPFNPIAEPSLYQATPRARRNEFANRLRTHGFLVTIRYSQGSDISAACGQLAEGRGARGEGRGGGTRGQVPGARDK